MSTDRILNFDEAHWTAVSANYERYAEPFTAQFARAAVSLAGGVRQGERVLDVAAGTGALSLAVAEAGGRILAIDSSPAMVARLRDRMQPFAGCEVRVMDGAGAGVGGRDFRRELLCLRHHVVPRLAARYDRACPCDKAWRQGDHGNLGKS